MPSLSCALLVAVHAAVFSALVIAPLTPASAMASPMPFPLPLRGPDYHSPARNGTALVQNGQRKNTRVKHVAVHNLVASSPARRTAVLALDQGDSHKTRRDAGDAHYKKLNHYYVAAYTHSQNLKSLAAQSSSLHGNDPDFDQQAASQLTAFHTQMLGFETVLRELGSDEGLHNYDRSNDFETLLKKIVNLHKDTLSYITTLTYHLPIVGTTLGPIVYEVKCILDEILDAAENLTDAIINALQPLLKPLIGEYFTYACNNGIGLPTCHLIK